MHFFGKQQMQIVPRWVIFIFDLSVAFMAFLFATAISYHFNIEMLYRPAFQREMVYAMLITATSFWLFKLYAGIVRYTSAVDSIRILSTVLFTVVIMLVIKLLFLAFNSPSVLPISLTIIYGLLLFAGLTIYRAVIKIFFQYTKLAKREIENVIVYGAGDLGLAVKRTLEHDVGVDKNIIAYLDDDEGKIGKSIDGLKIYDSVDLLKVIEKWSVDELIFATEKIPIEKKKGVIDLCLEHNISVLTLPPVQKIMNGDLSVGQIQKIKIEDFLGRPPIDISDLDIRNELQGKRVLVTGAAGSIGSEISRQLGKFEPQMIILCDQAETPLHNLQLDLQEIHKNQIYHAYIADVRNEQRMRSLFETFKPHYVYHAAAYKHVPMIENHPVEGVKTNVKGTYILANLSVEFKVSKFVFVSTDKAVNPTNVMGTTKRVAEIYVQSLNNYLQSLGKKTTTRFITTRFGNVLDSSGSVIPRFRSQIEKGGPLTVTHPEITRYFMTIPEACQLVIEAGNMGNGGEIFVFDMGKSVKILHLAEKMIKLSGYTPYKDIDIKFTGLRPGEKLYEELLNDLENTLPTPHEKIMIAKVRENNFETISTKLSHLLDVIDTKTDFEIVRFMKDLVPEFKSQNSVYEQLDDNAEKSPRINW